MTRTVYLDHNATTPLDPRALDAMMPYLTSEFGNPSSATHDRGLRAREAVEEARHRVASLIGAHSEEIIFTSGATEANNLALKGVLRPLIASGHRPHVVTTAIEHPSVLAPLREMERAGCSVTVLSPDPQGIVSPQRLRAAIEAETVLVSMMAANGELGTIQPVAEIGTLCRDGDLLLHTDATQAVGKIPVDVNDMNVDLLAMSAHKIYGPKGAGALFVRRGVVLEPLLTGGDQERGLRSGTLNVPGIVGLGAAAELCADWQHAGSRELTRLTERLWEGIRERVPDAVLNGHPGRRIPGTLNVAFPGVDAGRLMSALSRFALSAGSACHSGGEEISPVLAAIGLDPALASGTLRFGLGRSTAERDVHALLDALEQAVHRSGGSIDGGASSPVRYD
jgi:cysteine desulfurase